VRGMPTMNGRLLTSWKQISQYLGIGIRTAQRWERELIMPVRRPHRKMRSGVVALTDEIDVWLCREGTLVADSGHVKPATRARARTKAA
jgi:hypothetical protein